MIDNQVATSFGFSADDRSPTALIDLGKVCMVRRLSAVYSARPSSIDFYVMQSLPGSNRDESASTVTLEDKTLTDLKPVGSLIDDGTQGHASIEFPATTGRYVMLRWIPAAHDDTRSVCPKLQLSVRAAYHFWRQAEGSIPTRPRLNAPLRLMRRTCLIQRMFTKAKTSQRKPLPVRLRGCLNHRRLLSSLTVIEPPSFGPVL